MWGPWEYSQLAEHFASTHKMLGSQSLAPQKKPVIIVHAFYPSTQDIETGRPGAKEDWEFKVIHGCLPTLKPAWSSMTLSQKTKGKEVR